MLFQEHIERLIFYMIFTYMYVLYHRNVDMFWCAEMIICRRSTVTRSLRFSKWKTVLRGRKSRYHLTVCVFFFFEFDFDILMKWIEKSNLDKLMKREEGNVYLTSPSKGSIYLQFNDIAEIYQSAATYFREYYTWFYTTSYSCKKY